MSDKLKYLYKAYEEAAGVSPRITGSGALLTELEIAKGTLAAWCNGRSDKGRAADRIDSKHLARLAALVVAVAKPPITSAEAQRLWEKGSVGEFRRALSGTQEHSLRSVLLSRPPVLTVTPRRVGARSKGLEWIVVDRDQRDGEFALKRGEAFILDVGTQKGRALVVLGRSGEGWYLFLPDEEFDGIARQAHQCLPSTGHWEVPHSTGKHVIYIIEFSRGSAPLRRERGDLRLEPSQERLLVEELTDESLSGQWRWGSIDLHVSAP